MIQEKKDNNIEEYKKSGKEWWKMKIKMPNEKKRINEEHKAGGAIIVPMNIMRRRFMYF